MSEVMQRVGNYPNVQNHTVLEYLDFAEENMVPYTQANAVLFVLRRAAGWVCGTAFLQGFIPTYAQRVSELNRDGHTIMSRPCQDMMHRHRGAVHQYIIKEDE